MEIRQADSNDEESVLRLLSELRNHTSGEDVNLSEEQENDVRKYFAKVLEREDIFVFVVESENNLIAMAMLYVTPSIKHGSDRGIVEEVIVSNNYRRQGVGSQLLREILSFAKQQGIKVVKLNSGNELKLAHKFYRSLGGKQTELMFRFDL